MPDYTASAQALTQGAQNAIAALNAGKVDALGRYQTNYYDPYTKAGGQGLDMSLNALGLNGDAGNKAAVGAFHAGPGYQFAMDQGLQALERAAAARGMLGSGNTTADILKFAQGLANQEYNNWQNRVGGLAQLGYGAAQGQTGRQGDLAGIDMNTARAAADVWNNYGQNISNLYQPRQQQGGSGLGSAIGAGLGLAGTLLGGQSVGNALSGAFGGNSGGMGYSSGALGAGSYVSTFF